MYKLTEIRKEIDMHIN